MKRKHVMLLAWLVASLAMAALPWCCWLGAASLGGCIVYGHHEAESGRL